MDENKNPELPLRGEGCNPGECCMCTNYADELCGGNVCRACHKSLTFESCVDGSWVRELWRKNGSVQP